MKKQLITTVLAIALAMLFVAGTALSSSQYNVFCANGKIEIDTRSLDQMKSARGSGTCLLQGFNYRSDADNFAKQLGGVGAACKCN